MAELEDPRPAGGAVVVGVDGSTSSDRALTWAATQAVLEGRPLLVVHVVSESALEASAWAGVTWLLPTPNARLLADAEALVAGAADAARRAHPALVVHTHVVRGDVRRELLALSRDADLLVLGSHGRGTVGSAVLGSVGARLARFAECPLVVVRPGRAGLVRDGVLLAADGTSASLPVVRHGFQQASYHRLPLTVVHAGGGTPDDDARLLSESLAGFGEDFPDVRVTSRVEERLLDAVTGRRARPFDLVVVGRHPIDTPRRRLSHPTATLVLEHADCPVAVVPEAWG